MSDIVTRLRGNCPGCNRMQCKAADEIESLRAEIARLREERLTFCTVDGYPGKFGMKPLPPGPEGDG